MSHFSFEYPWFLGFISFFIVCAIFCKLKARAIYFPHLDRLLIGREKKSTWFIFLVKWLGIFLAVVALASPIVKKEYSNSKKHGRDIVLIIDSSESMRQQGFDQKNREKNKFDVVQEVASDFVLGRENDRIGLITFADIAFIASPLTFERLFLEKIIALQRLGPAGKRTAINDAVVQSYGMLEGADTKTKVVILLTDGIDNMSQTSVEDVLSLIEKSDIKLYTIGIGAKGDFDESYLKRLAKAGRGKAFIANSSAMLTRIYKHINRLETSKIEAKKVVQQRYLFIYPLVCSLVLLLLFIYLRTFRSVV